jgi:hypothetical protein
MKGIGYLSGRNAMKKLTVLVCLLVFTLSACSTNANTTLTPTQSKTPSPIPTLTFTPTRMPIRIGEYELLTPEDMRYDLDELFHRIETTHPHPYTKRSKAEIDIDRQMVYDELDQSMNIFDFYNVISPLITSLGDHHTQVFLPQKVFGQLSSQEIYLTLEVKFAGQRGYVTNNYISNSEIPLGAEVLSVNSMAIAEIKNELTTHNLMNYPFSLGLWILNGSLPSYNMEFLLPEDASQAKLTISSLSVEMFDHDSTSSQPWEPVEYTKIQNEPIGVLTVNTFEGIGRLLTTSFTKIKEDNIQYLVIDIRENRGGKYADVDSLMDFLTNQPYKHCARSYEAPFSGYGSGAPRETECELIQPFNAFERFQGKFYLLIGPQTNSAAITFATIIQDYELAPLIGEETTDKASYCANIVLEGTPLPRTGLMYTVSKTCYVRPSGVLDDLPVTPNVIVDTSIDDQINGKDPVLEYTLNLISALP